MCKAGIKVPTNEKQRKREKCQTPTSINLKSIPLEEKVTKLINGCSNEERQKILNYVYSDIRRYVNQHNLIKCLPTIETWFNNRNLSDFCQILKVYLLEIKEIIAQANPHDEILKKIENFI